MGCLQTQRGGSMASELGRRSGGPENNVFSCPPDLLLNERGESLGRQSKHPVARVSTVFSGAAAWLDGR